MRGTLLRGRRGQLLAGLTVAGVVGAGAAAGVSADRTGIFERLSGYEEVPALSTPGRGKFNAWINRSGTEIKWWLQVNSLDSDFLQAHIHFENETNNGPVIVFLCSNLGNGPEGTQACPVDGGSIRGTIRAADVLAGGADQGLATGEIRELSRAIREGATYVNVHTEGFPSGEIRAQLGDDDDHEGGDHSHG